MDLHELAESLQAYTTQLRRCLHRHPELSGEEAWTAARIRQELDALGIPYTALGYNTIGRLALGPGARIAVRADIDALPIDEKNDLPWKSEIPGRMHACGHDGHTAILLSLARALSECPEVFNGTVYLCFQSGEEKGLGARECVEWLAAQGGVDGVMGLHLAGEMPAGAASLEAGARAAGSIAFCIRIRGRGGHGARPDLTVNPLRIACDVFQRLLAIPGADHDPTQPCVVSPCMLHGGARPNIVPDTAEIEGTIRFFDPADSTALPETIRRIAVAAAQAYGGSAELETRPVSTYPVINDAACIERARRAAAEMGIPLVPGGPPAMMSDNFSEFQHRYPGFYWNLGCASPRAWASGIPHSPDFDMDDTVLHRATELHLRYLAMLAREA